MGRSVDAQCRAFRAAIEVLGRPWTAQILTVLHSGPLRFREIATGLPGVGDKILSARLKELESRSLVQRQVDPGPPVRVSYQLTKQGSAFERVAEAIERWGRELVSDERARRRRRTA